MSQEAMQNQGGERDINLSSNPSSGRKNYEGFEGMNYEQFRQPFDPKHKDRNNSNDERNSQRRPDKG